MENIIYKIEDNSIEHLKDIGFRHIGDGTYIYEFAGYKWQGYTTITCKINAYDDTDIVTVDVFQEDGRLYAPYYLDESNSRVLAVVKANINKEFGKLGVKKYVRKQKERHTCVIDRRKK